MNIYLTNNIFFRQDTLITGEESWEDMESMASSRLDRCMRMCKLKMSKTPDPKVIVLFSCM